MFNGVDYEAKHDEVRLRGQIGRIYSCMIDGRWRTLQEIQNTTGDGQASISAQLRNLKKDKFGGFILEKRTRGDRRRGLYEYRVLSKKYEQLDFF